MLSMLVASCGHHRVVCFLRLPFCKNAMVASSKPNSDKFSHSAQFYFTCSSVPEFLQSMGGLEPKYNEYSGMAHSLCSGVRSDMQWAWSLYLNTTPWIKTLQFKS